MSNKFQQTVLRRCNELALRSQGPTGTNPHVGAIVIENSTLRILGEGWHQKFGGPHAEINAIENASRHHNIQRQTIAVSLEPCNHTGKTPACTKAILDNHLSTVIIDQIDPDPRMTGLSIDKLRQAGLRVGDPLSTFQGEKVLQPFMIGVRFQRPYIRLKMAISQDGFIGHPGKQVKISNVISDRWVHRLRSETQAIMVGTHTILQDNPSLSSRYGNRNQPVRIVPDRRGILPDNLKIFNDGSDVETIVLTASNRKDYRAKILKTDPHDLASVFKGLFEKFHIGSILIEGGSRLFTSIFEASLWDELIIIQNTQLHLNSGVSAPPFPGFPLQRQLKFGSDTINFIINPRSR